MDLIELTANNLRPGDIWKDITLVTVQHLPADQYYPNGRVRVSGHLGRRKTNDFWTFHPDQHMEVTRWT